MLRCRTGRQQWEGAEAAVEWACTAAGAGSTQAAEGVQIAARGGAWEGVGSRALDRDGHRRSSAARRAAVHGVGASHTGLITCSAGASRRGLITCSAAAAACSAGAIRRRLAALSAAAAAVRLHERFIHQALPLRLALPPGSHLLKQPAKLLQLALRLCSGALGGGRSHMHVARMCAWFLSGCELLGWAGLVPLPVLLRPQRGRSWSEATVWRDEGMWCSLRMQTHCRAATAVRQPEEWAAAAAAVAAICGPASVGVQHERDNPDQLTLVIGGPGGSQEWREAAVQGPVRGEARLQAASSADRHCRDPPRRGAGGALLQPACLGALQPGSAGSADLHGHGVWY